MGSTTSSSTCGRATASGGGLQTLDVFGEIFNLTNRTNFVNPTGDRRSGNFLVPTTLEGGGYPRQFQVGVRYGFLREVLSRWRSCVRSSPSMLMFGESTKPCIVWSRLGGG
jgi:hypothetical protein